MPIPHSLTEPAQNEGEKKGIRVYRKGRKCRKCGTPLSIYTPGTGQRSNNLTIKNKTGRFNWCQVHMAYGLNFESELDKKREERNRKVSSNNAYKKKKIKSVKKIRKEKSHDPQNRT